MSDILLNQSDDDNLSEYLQQGVNYLQSEQIEKAHRVFLSILNKYPEDFNALHFCGITTCLLGDIDKGINLITRSIAIDSSRFSPFFNLGKFCLLKQDYESSEESFKSAIVNDNSQFEAWELLAKSQFCLNKFQCAIESQSKACQLNVSNPDLYITKGKYLEAVKDIENALVAYQTAITLNSSKIEAWSLLSDLYLKQKYPEKAIMCLKELIKRNPDDVNAIVSLGETLQSIGRANESLDYFRQLITIKSESYISFYNLGVSLWKVGDIDHAIINLKQALIINPYHASSHHQLGHIYEDLNMYNEALLCYKNAAFHDNQRVEYISTYARRLSKYQEDQSESIQLLKNCLAIKHDHVNSIKGLGKAYLRSNNQREGIIHYSTMLKTNPNDNFSVFYLFQLLKRNLVKQRSEKFSYSKEFLYQALNQLDASRIIAFGDSHIYLFKGHEEIQINHIGAATAYNLANQNSSTEAPSYIFNKLSLMNHRTDVVLLCFGEIDIRAHVVKRCQRTGESIRAVVKDVAQKYIDFAQQITQIGFRVIIYGGYGAGTDNISYGSAKERNYAAFYFNKHLAEVSRSNNIGYFSLHKYFQDDIRLRTNHKFLADGFHLYSQDTNLAEIQLLLFERMYGEAKSLTPQKFYRDEEFFLLNIYGEYSSLNIASNKLNGWKHISQDFIIESITFDLGGKILLRSLLLERNYIFNDILLDGRNVLFQQSKETRPSISFSTTDIRPARYITIKASNLALRSIKSIDFVYNNYIDKTPQAQETDFIRVRLK